ncbi:Carboxypeptidase regulatory-like domain-containing protein [bacterium JGI 053]|nr:Carboxypeptidase regulatory-like domain-containing protein [bacterium JGI 053]
MPPIPLSRLAATLLVAASASLAPRISAAQAVGMGSIRGRAYAAAERTPVAYALIRLTIPGDSAGRGRTAISDAQGAFAFAAVVPGTYRLSLERIGYTAEATEPFAVAEGEVVERNLASRSTAVALAPIVATEECRSAADLGRNPQLAALWGEALKAIETSRAFTDGYLYSYEQHQSWSADNDEAPVQTRVSRIVNDPRQRRPADRDHGGWGNANALGLYLDVPEGREILDPAFLTTHCLEGDVDQTPEGFELGFRPIRTQRQRIDIRGAVRVDRRTLQVSAIDLEYLEGSAPFMKATVEYQDAIVPGGTVRVAAGMRFVGRPPPRAHLGPVRGQVVFTNYRDLVKVDAEPRSLLTPGATLAVEAAPQDVRRDGAPGRHDLGGRI